MPSKVNRRTINLLEPIGTPSDTWSVIYNWVFNVGRYLMLSIEVIVLVVFFSRFILDKQNHDLTEEINDKAFILSNESLRNQEIKFRNTQLLLNDITKLSNNQLLNSEEISLLLSSIPEELTLDKFSFSGTKISLFLTGDEIKDIRDYEFSLRQDTRYKDVSVTVSKSGANQTVYDVGVSFSLISDEDKK
ncbi:hypothetical protein HYV12_04465 [Candidatus Dojkabacteria bacterium]|nr:hypothetical protein [Candidatus Dojkabacteria bacterium]